MKKRSFIEDMLLWAGVEDKDGDGEVTDEVLFWIVLLVIFSIIYVIMWIILLWARAPLTLGV